MSNDNNKDFFLNKDILIQRMPVLCFYRLCICWRFETCNYGQNKSNLLWDKKNCLFLGPKVKKVVVAVPGKQSWQIIIGNMIWHERLYNLQLRFYFLFEQTLLFIISLKDVNWIFKLQKYVFDQVKSISPSCIKPLDPTGNILFFNFECRFWLHSRNSIPSFSK